MNSIRHPICGVDGSDAARRAAYTALRLADRLGDRLVLVHVIPSRPPMPAAAVPIGAHRLSSVASDKDARPSVVGTRGRSVATAALLGSVAATLSGRASRPVVVVPDAEPEHDAAVAVTAANLARALDVPQELARATFPVVGSRGHGPMRSARLGSVSARLTRLAPCPVASVPPDAQNAAWDDQARGDEPHAA